MKTLFTFLILIRISLISVAQPHQLAVNVQGATSYQEATGYQIVNHNGYYYRIIPANLEGHQVDESSKAKGDFLTKILFGGSKHNIIGLLGGRRKSAKRSPARRSSKQQVAAMPYSKGVNHASIYVGSTMPQNIGNYLQATHYEPLTSNGMQPSALPYTPGQNISQYQQPMHDNTQPNYTGQSYPQGQTTASGQTGYPLQNSYQHQQSPYASGQNSGQYQQTMHNNQQPNGPVQSYPQGQTSGYEPTGYPRQNSYQQRQSPYASARNIVQYQQPMHNNQQPKYPVQSYPQGQINSYVPSGYLPQGAIQANAFVQSPTQPKRKKQIGKKIFKSLGTALEIAGDLGVPGIGMVGKVVNKINK